MTLSDVRKLSDEDINCDIAELVGWKDVRIQDYYDPLIDDVNQSMVGKAPGEDYFEPIPNYCQDLNAMQQCTVKLTV